MFRIPETLGRHTVGTGRDLVDRPMVYGQAMPFQFQFQSHEIQAASELNGDPELPAFEKWWIVE